MLKKIECFIQPSKLDVIKNELINVGIDGMSVSEVKGFGKQRGHLTGNNSGTEVKLLPKIKIEIVVDEEILDKVIDRIMKLSTTGTFGAGKIFVLPVEDAIRIRTEESGIRAVR